MLVLGIETSCDETGASVVADGERILSNVIATSLTEHSKFGGVVPEIASRYHVEWVDRVVSQAASEAEVSLQEIDAIAVTQGPGLPGALMVGIAMAKAMALALGKPLLGVHHLQAHLYANFLEFSGIQSIPSPLMGEGQGGGGQRWNHPPPNPLPSREGVDLNFPYMGLIVSGGHTILVLVRDIDHYQIIGQTTDDAAGEAFDKVAKLMGLGYPGGPVIDAKAKEGNPKAVNFPRAMIHEKNFDFSFSGVKTAVLYHLQKQCQKQETRKKKQENTFQNPVSCFLLPASVLNDLCASFQEAVVDVLVKKSLRACEEFSAATLVVGGGVAANNRLRERFKEEGPKKGLRVLFPPKGLSIDNAAMIAGLGGALFKKGYQSELSISALPHWNIEGGRLS